MAKLTLKNIGGLKFSDKVVALNNQAADKAIKSIRTKGIALRQLAHNTACGIMLHYVEHGDYTRLDSLHEVVGEVMGNAMARGFVDWVVKFSSLKWHERDPKVPDDKSRFYHVKGVKPFFMLEGDASANANSVEYMGAYKAPFFSASFGDKPPFKYDFDKAMQSVMNQILTAIHERDEAQKSKDKNLKATVEKRVQLDREKADKVLQTLGELGIKPTKTFDSNTATAGNA